MKQLYSHLAVHPQIIAVPHVRALLFKLRALGYISGTKSCREGTKSSRVLPQALGYKFWMSIAPCRYAGARREVEVGAARVQQSLCWSAVLLPGPGGTQGGSRGHSRRLLVCVAMARPPGRGLGGGSKHREPALLMQRSPLQKETSPSSSLPIKSLLRPRRWRTVGEREASSKNASKQPSGMGWGQRHDRYWVHDKLHSVPLNLTLQDKPSSSIYSASLLC